MSRLARRPLRRLALGLAMLGMAAGARAADPPPPAVAMPSDMPARLEAAEKLVKIMHLDTQLDSIMPQVVDLMLGTLAQGNIGHEEQIRQILGEELNTAFSDERPEFLQLYRDIYARNLTLAEMAAMSAFYSSEAGQSVLAKTPQLTMDGMQSGATIGQKAARAAIPRIIQRMQAAKLEVPKGT